MAPYSLHSALLFLPEESNIISYFYWFLDRTVWSQGDRLCWKNDKSEGSIAKAPNPRLRQCSALLLTDQVGVPFQMQTLYRLYSPCILYVRATDMFTIMFKNTLIWYRCICFTQGNMKWVPFRKCTFKVPAGRFYSCTIPINCLILLSKKSNVICTKSTMSEGEEVLKVLVSKYLSICFISW